MAMFKQVATDQLKVLFFAFMLGNAFHAVPANPDNSCGSDFYLGLLTTHYFLVFHIFASAMLLLAVRMAINTAETTVGASGRRAFEAMGLASVPDGWKRSSLRVLLQLAVFHSGIASCLAFVTFEEGYFYRTGCHDMSGVGSRSVILVFLAGAVYAFSSWVATKKN